LFAVLFLLVWGAGFGAGGVLALRAAYRSFRLATAAVATTCRVQGASVETDNDEDGTEYHARLRYTFNVDGNLLDGSAVIGGHHDGEAEAQAIASRYPPGTDVPCWFDPRDATNTSVEHDESLVEALVKGALGVVFVALPILILSWQFGLLRRWREFRTAKRRTSDDAFEALPLPAARRAAGQTLPIALVSDSGADGGVALLVSALLWNGVSFPFFVFSLVAGQPLAAAFLLIFVLVGAYLAWLAAKPYTRCLRKVPIVELEREPIAPGERIRVMLRQPGPVILTGIQVDYVCQERVTYTVGTDFRTETRVLHEKSLLTDSYVQVTAQEPWCPTFEIAVPEDLPGSFEAPHNFIEHQLRIRASIQKSPDLDETYTLLVLPALEVRS
jgi:hypothetical protein